MIELLTSPEAWAALLTLTALEIVLGVDNVIFLSVVVARIPPLPRVAGGRDRTNEAAADVGVERGTAHGQ